MNRFYKFSTFFHSFYIAGGHPSVDVLQVEDFEDGAFAHLGIQRIDDAAFFDAYKFDFNLF